jgi:hypothetical protein
LCIRDGLASTTRRDRYTILATSMTASCEAVKFSKEPLCLVSLEYQSDGCSRLGPLVKCYRDATVIAYCLRDLRGIYEMCSVPYL